jgi:hypothetical protein
MEDCVVHFVAPDLYGKISVGTFCLMQWNRRIGETSDAVLLQFRESHEKMEGYLIRLTNALSRLSAGITTSCPHLIWIDPTESLTATGGTGKSAKSP